MRKAFFLFDSEMHHNLHNNHYGKAKNFKLSGDRFFMVKDYKT